MVKSERVVSRYRQAMEFPSEKALNDYLKDHPDADKAQHKVNEGKAKGGPDDKSKGRSKAQPPPIPDAAKPKPPSKPPSKPPPVPDDAKPKVKPPAAEKPKPPQKLPPRPVRTKPETKTPEAKPKPTWKDRFKDLSEKASKSLAAAPATVQQFFKDDVYRGEAIKAAKASLVKTQGKVVNSLVESAKHEVKEYKSASEGVGRVLAGKKMTKHQTTAFKTVASHMAIMAASVALAASGPLGVSAAIAKGLATRIAAKAVSRSVENLHILGELGHVGHGVVEFLSHIAAEGKKKKMSPDDAMAMLVMASVSKELDALTDEDLKAALEEDEATDKKASERVVTRFIAGQL